MLQGLSSPFKLVKQEEVFRMQQVPNVKKTKLGERDAKVKIIWAIWKLYKNIKGKKVINLVNVKELLS